MTTKVTILRVSSMVVSIHEGASNVCAGRWRTASTAGGRGDDSSGSFMLWRSARCIILAIWLLYLSCVIQYSKSSRAGGGCRNWFCPQYAIASICMSVYKSEHALLPRFCSVIFFLVKAPGSEFRLFPRFRVPLNPKSPARQPGRDSEFARVRLDTLTSLTVAIGSRRLHVSVEGRGYISSPRRSTCSFWASIRCTPQSTPSPSLISSPCAPRTPLRRILPQLRSCAA
jgi:hypothetical protein